MNKNRKKNEGKKERTKTIMKIDRMKKKRKEKIPQRNNIEERRRAKKRCGHNISNLKIDIRR